MEKDGWKGLFRPENKMVRSNVMLALFVGILLLAAGKGFSSREITVEKSKSVTLSLKEFTTPSDNYLANLYLMCSAVFVSLYRAARPKSIM